MTAKLPGIAKAVARSASAGAFRPREDGVTRAARDRAAISIRMKTPGT
jgi:hypothetical protein